MPVGEHAEQHELELLALADDGALDLVEETTAQLGEIPDLHQMRFQGGDDALEAGLVDPALELVGRLAAGPA